MKLPTPIIADASDWTTQGATVTVNGSPVARCRRAVALWNGGPGYAVYLTTRADGNFIMADNGREVAWAVLVGLVRIKFRGQE